MSKNVKVNLWPPFRRAGTTIWTRTSGDDVHLEGDLEVDGTSTLDGAVLVAGVALKTTADVDWYVDDATGDDTTGDGSLALPWKTRQKAYNQIPDVVAHKVTIHLSDDTFYAAGDLNGRYITTNGAITIIGATTTMLASQTATGGDDIDANGQGQIIVAGGLGVNTYQNYWVRFTTTTGPAAYIYEKYVKIISHDDTTIITTMLRFTPSAATTFDIVRFDTTLSGATVGTPNTVYRVTEKCNNMQVSTDSWFNGFYSMKPVTYEALNMVNGLGITMRTGEANVQFSGIHFGLTDPAAMTYHYALSIFTAASYVTAAGIYIDGYSKNVCYIQEGAIVNIRSVLADYTTTTAGVSTIFSVTTGSSLNVSDYCLLGDITHPITSALFASGNGSYAGFNKGRIVYATNIMRAQTGGYVYSNYADTIFGTNNTNLHNITNLGRGYIISQTNAGTSVNYVVDDSSITAASGGAGYYVIGDMIKAQTGILAATTLPLGYVNNTLAATAPRTLTSTPTITNGVFDGQKMTLIGTDDTNTITLQDETVLPNTTVQLLNDATVTLGAGDKLNLAWNATTSMWEETGNTFMNMLFSGTTGNKNIYLEDNQADTLSFTEGVNKYLTFRTTDTTEAIRAIKPLWAGSTDVPLILQSQTGLLAGDTLHSVLINPGFLAENYDHNCLTLLGTQTGADTEMLAGLNIWLGKQGTGTLANSYGVIIRDTTVGGGALTTQIGLKVNSLISATNNYAIYSDANNYYFILGAAHTMTFSATTHTGANVLSLDFDVTSASCNGLAIDGEASTALSAGETVNGIYIDVDGLAGDSATSSMNGMYLTSANTTGGVNSAINIAGTWDAHIVTTGDLLINAVGGNVAPSTNDGAALGIATTGMWSDLYLADGGTIDWNNGDVIISHASNQLSIGGALFHNINQANGTTGLPVAFTVTGGAHTGITALTEDYGLNLNMGATKTWASGVGTLANQREVYIQAPTYACAAAPNNLTIADAYTFYVTGAPIQGANMTLTRTWAAGFNGNIGVGAGTALLPAYSFVGDPNTGMYGNGDVGSLAAGGTQIALWSSSGFASNYFRAKDANTTVTLAGRDNDDGTAVGIALDNETSLTTAGGKLISIRNATVEKASIDIGGKGIFTIGSIQVKRSVADTGNPPTDTQLDAAFGDPTVVGSGFIGILDDADLGVNCYICWTTGTAGEWFWTQGTKAL